MILHALRVWAETHGRAPLSDEWIRADYGRPSRSTVIVVFGTWNNALASAGLAIRRAPETWSRERIIEAIQRWAAAHGGKPPRAIDCDNHPELPSRTVVNRRFGSWNAAIHEAGFFPRWSRAAYTDPTLTRRVLVRAA